MIEAVGLAKHYRQGQSLVRALDGVSFRVEDGEFLAVVGRSGSGKTTLLDVLGLLLRPTAGRLLLDGADTAGLSEGRRADLRGRQIGFIFQEFNLLPTLTAIENVMLPVRYSRARIRPARGRALELLRAVGLEDRGHHRPDELSGGQAQRVAIARALVNSPSLVLGDEPTGEVDSETSDELVGLMRSLNREQGVTFIIVTHDAEIAARTDRVIRLRDGRVLTDERRNPRRYTTSDE